MIHFSSDHHFCHNNVIRYCNRPFSSVEEMNEGMVSNWNELIKPEDTVYYLGDFSMAFRPVELFTNRLNGTKILVHGNHEFSHPYHKKSRTPENQQKWIQKYIDNGWKSIQNELVIEHKGLKFKLHHLPYPYVGETEHEDKYKKFRPIDDGTILLCGHIHEKWRIKRSSKGTLMINVGVDVWDFKPVSIDQILGIVKQNELGLTK